MPTASPNYFVEYLLKALYDPIFLGQPLLPPAALSVLIQLWRKYNCTNVLAAAVARITRINPTMLDAYNDALLLVNGVYNPTQIAPHCGLSSDLTVLAREHGIAAALPSVYYHTLVVGNNNSPLLDGLMSQDGTRTSLPPLSLRCCLVGCERLLVKQFQPGYTLGWLCAWLQSPTCAAQVCKACQMLCSACAKEAAEVTATGRRKVWEGLLGCFELPAWGVEG
ncbi:hypothetical protein B0H14DRAFT_3476577 [Mycena olivaceomarginata]|nr:hypothetical protein B0H14DRAFT_3476577 [Mycena olivaceomarginata]